MKEPEKSEEEQQEQPRSNRLQKVAAILVLALVVFVAVDGYFNKWSTVRTLANLSTLQLRNTPGKTWDLTARQDFQIRKVGDVRTIVYTDSLLAFDRPYREAGYYRLYFRISDSSSARLHRLYQALLDADSSQTIRHTVENAQRAYQNLHRILHPGQSIPHDSSGITPHDSSKTIAKGDLALGAGDETESVVRKYASSPQVLLGAGLGIVASATVDWLRGDAFVAWSREDVFRIDSLSIGSQSGTWEGSPIDILWAFAPKDTLKASPDSVRLRENEVQEFEKDSAAGGR